MTSSPGFTFSSHLYKKEEDPKLIKLDLGTGDSENIFNLSPEDLKIRDIITIDIAKDNQPGYTFPPDLYRAEEDPKLITLDLGTSTVGPLRENWSLRANPVMTVYKLVRIRFCWRGLQGWIEGKIADFERNLFTVFNRRVYCWMD